MKKSTYLIIAGILSFGFVPRALDPFSMDIWDIFMYAWTAFGFFYYKDYAFTYTRKNQTYVYLILVLFILSALSPVFRYGQSFISTLIATRRMLTMFFLLTLFKIGPTDDDMYKCFRVLGFLALIEGILIYFFPSVFVEQKNIMSLYRAQKQGATDILVSAPGYRIAVIYLLFLIQRMRERCEMKYFILSTIFFAYVLIAQNRSTLIWIMPCYIWGILRANIRFKVWILLGIALVAGAFVMTILSSLYEETNSQMSDIKYNRWQAVIYYLFEYKYSLYSFLFGNGLPCANSIYLHQLDKIVQTRKAILSDIGMLGSYFCFGILTMTMFYIPIIKGAIYKYMPLYLRMYCGWLIFVPTIHLVGFDVPGTMLILMIIYLVIYHTEQRKLSIESHGRINYNS